MQLKKIVLTTVILLSSTFSLAQEKFEWIQVEGAEDAQKFFIDLKSIKSDAEVTNFKNFVGMFNLVLNDDTQGSIVAQFTLDCGKKLMRTGATKTYDQFNGKGEVLEEDMHGSPDFFPLNDQIRARAILSTVCKQK